MQLRTAITTAIWMAASSLTACASGTGSNNPGAHEPPLLQLESGQPTQFKPGDTAILPDGSHLTYQSLASDSRCKPGVQCVWAGDAEARFVHTTRADVKEIFSIHTELQPRSKTLGATTLHMRGVDWKTPPNVTVELK